MMSRKIPMSALQQSVYSILSEKQTTPVYEDVPQDEPLPYITLGAFTCKRLGNKTTDISSVTLQVHIRAERGNREEVNEIANDITAVLTSWPVDLSADKFLVVSQDVGFFKAFPEETAAYHGICTFIAQIQTIGG